MVLPVKATEASAAAIDKVHYTHEAMIDLILTNPGIQQQEIAKHFGYTGQWVCQVMNSDAFQVAFAERRKEMVDPTVAASIDEKMRTVVSQSLDIVMKKLESTQSPEMALKALDITSKALGYGVGKPGGNTNISFVVALPQKVPNAADWADAHRPGGGAKIIEQE